jgi:hypothetical protein
MLKTLLVMRLPPSSDLSWILILSVGRIQIMKIYDIPSRDNHHHHLREVVCHALIEKYQVFLLARGDDWIWVLRN